MFPSDGHGTHVAGTLVGKAWDYSPTNRREIDKFSGIASDAKLAFFDVSYSVEKGVCFYLKCIVVVDIKKGNINRSEHPQGIGRIVFRMGVSSLSWISGYLLNRGKDMKLVRESIVIPGAVHHSSTILIPV